jgi:hypothetical protein
MSVTDSLSQLCLPTFGAVIGLGLGLLWRASQVARARRLSWASALRVVVGDLFGW